MLGILLGMGAACVLWACIMVTWIIIAHRRDDRRFKAMMKGMDAGRTQAWRELGVSEKTIKDFYIRRAKLMKDAEIT